MAPENPWHGSGILRREFLQVGFSGVLGMGLPGLLAGQAAASNSKLDSRASSRPRAKSVILVFLTGGLSHIDSLDMKPDAPDGIRGEFQPIETAVPGIRICEHLPRLAEQAGKLAIVRTISHGQTNHLNGTHQVLTGHSQPGAFFDKIASRDDYPCYASAVDAIRPRSDGVPSGVMLPTYLMEGPLTWPGQHAGFLGPKHDPWQIKQDPNSRDFRVESLAMPSGFGVERLQRRRELFEEIAAQRDRLGATSSSSPAKDPFDAQRELAYSLILSGKVARAFELEREDPRMRDRYGRHMYGQSLLLARRLVQAGVPLVQVNMGRVQTWDTHSNNFKTLKERLLPPTDRGVATLLEDLATTGMLDETLVVVAGEFGRTPRIGQSTGNANGRDGRDHWAKVFSVALAGGGVRGGQVIGQSDKMGAYPASQAHSPADLAATIYQALGIDPATELHDRLGRPIKLCEGAPIARLFTA
ncbi:DUF1501 domain-containing protein [Singulisphaera acidiphila]|uniref:Arylsulfatase A family protein n=1 Tax=Singulisphaera acidiphila (strain ATCC BAA-1392 / DSM 18658 / VKM B-2454 / MOB10) TaxID=886293 RepID=L0DAF6_SINAD|nr:DUF1501 domain-containing protein [Singulisphaera acidiphila]AGA25641.1 hypothetical protein Sinac_1252 [Singulisphaera acidiphila DSM 18658]